MKKYYKVLKDTPIWIKGAIIYSEDGNGYYPTNDVYKTDANEINEYLSCCLVENQPEWFQRVYLIERIGRSIFLTKKEAVDKLEQLDSEEKSE